MTYKRKILVTGGAGFIGSSLADRLIADPDNYVVIVDNMLTGHRHNLPDPKLPNWKFIKCNVNNYSDISAVMFSHRFDFVFHYAAVVGVQRTLANPTLVLEDVQGIKNMLDLSKNTGVQRFFYASSSEVYGESVSYPQDEIQTPLNSRLPYAVVKNLGEAYCTSYHKEYGLDYTIFRFFNTYGPKQSTDFVMSRFINFALANQDITIYGDGQQSRTFCFVDDNVDAALTSLYQKRHINNVVNIGNDVEVRIIDLAHKILELTDSKSKVVYCPPLKEGDMRRRVPNIDRMCDLLDRPLISLETGIKHLLRSGRFGQRAYEQANV